MKKYLLPKEGNFYKANMHMHTTISDGKMTPEETKEAFLKEGYSIVAFTDHEIMVPHPELTDENFIALTSVEISINERRNIPFIFTKTYHLNLYSKDPNKTTYNCFDKSILWLDKAKEYATKEQMDIQYDRVYTVDCINEMIEMSKKEGFFVSLNHPAWSLQNYTDYINLKGLWGVEWHNSTCVGMGYSDTITPIDDLLRVGENVFPLATDDAHKKEDCFGGFLMVKAPELKYDIVYDALARGDFYSSEKPLINELYIEDGIIHINTSKAKKIIVSADKRYTCPVIASEGEYLTDTDININWFLERCNSKINEYEYIRITVVDEDGNIAYTRAYSINELK